ncbi:MULTISPECIES: acetate/propionate family kinase [unclassified Ruminococcus]|uniref:acetate/propionate family kinase n=1 Tax=unclassified Ruminococcus TaxID=2608920 RepID=UPI0021091123|nr:MULTISPECIES: acetate kinase [unclassified Ruminococcus]MCQ4022893.1 acetate/propionate family kinase [Ruminococcus sp. zg-924]MCQ4115291.1 acetate/propionate family kinase [Ruminococcus sp. zg-921]
MKILVINAGSSSLKYQLFDMDNETVLAKGNCERIGIDGIFTHKTSDGRVLKKNVDMPDHKVAFMQVKDALIDNEYGVIKTLSEVSALGHRIVQGGALFSKSELVTDDVIKGIESLIPLAPLHNKGHVQALRASQEVFGKDVPQVVVFDTAFHSTMPDYAYIYPIPYEYYEKYQIRRYGFHGTSHRYVTHRCAELMGVDIKDIKIISCHLGNGSSITAVEDGKVIDTSMGLTPLDGFMMGTRTGTLDPSVVTFLAEKEHLSPEEMSDLLNKKSGLLGISGVSSDDRDVTKAAEDGNERAILAHQMLVYEISKFIGSYYIALGGCDVITFTAGLGENQAHHRERICDNLACLGVKLDKKLNDEMILGKEGLISAPDSKIKVYVIPTNEELVIARDTKAIVEK